MRQYIIFAIDGSEYEEMYRFMLGDVLNYDDFKIVVDNPKHKVIKKILLSKRIRCMIGSFIDCFGYETNNLYREIEKHYDDYDSIVVVFFNSFFYYNAYLPNTLKKYKEKWPKLKMVLYYIDIMSSGVCVNANMLRNNDIFDLVYSIEKKDVFSYNVRLWNTIYSENQKYIKTNIQRDIYFCGAIKGREKYLEKILLESEKRNIDCNMDLVISSENEMVSREMRRLAKCHNKRYMKYSSVLQSELAANCILEIVQHEQTALTLRPYEAVLYNRKLLTNCKAIIDFDYYDSRYMQYFSSVEEIDWDWVKDRCEVNYNYSGEYSPLKLVKDINCFLYNDC